MTERVEREPGEVCARLSTRYIYILSTKKAPLAHAHARTRPLEVGRRDRDRDHVRSSVSGNAAREASAEKLTEVASGEWPAATSVAIVVELRVIAFVVAFDVIVALVVIVILLLRHRGWAAARRRRAAAQRPEMRKRADDGSGDVERLDLIDVAVDHRGHVALGLAP